MSRYEFTDANGYLLGRVEASTAADARTKATGRWDSRAVHCSHLSDDHTGEGIDPVFFYGPDAVS